MASKKLFITFSEELLKQLNVTIDRTYHYFDDEGERIELIEKKVDPLASNNKTVKLEDLSREWIEARKSRSLFLNIKIKISNIVNIFHGTNQACDSKAKLGVGLSRKATKSKFKYCKKIAEIDDYMDELDAAVENIEIKSADSDIDFNVFFYVIKPGNSSDRKGFANSEGMIVSLEKARTIIVNGNGSFFPIEQYTKQGDPLWKIKVNFVDWTEDEFVTDNVAIILNPSHSLYERIDPQNESYDEEIFKEVISSSLSALIIEILNISKQQGNYDALLGESLEAQGSILAAIRYFRDALGFLVTKSTSELVESIKVFFDKEKKICK